MKERPFIFEEIYQANYQKVLRICMGYVNGDDAQAKDLAQDIFIKVWQHLKSFRKEASVSTWIYRITINTCLLQLRGKKIIKGSKTLERVTDVEEETHPSKENQLKQMYQCINKLPRESKGIILLELEGLSQKEISEVMGLSHEAVRVRVHRIKTRLTKCVQNDSI